MLYSRYLRATLKTFFQCSLMKDINAQTQRSITHTKQNILYTDKLLHSYIIAEVKRQDPSEQLPTNNEVLRKEKLFGMLSLASWKPEAGGILPNKSTYCLPRQSSRDKSKKCSDKTLEISLSIVIFMNIFKCVVCMFQPEINNIALTIFYMDDLLYSY